MSVAPAAMQTGVHVRVEAVAEDLVQATQECVGRLEQAPRTNVLQPRTLAL